MDMRRNVFSKYLLAQAIVIALVMIIFRVIADRQVAATVAGFLFVLLPLVLMVLEYRRAKFAHPIWFAAVLQFWILFALPILGIRLLNWGVPFDQLSAFGVPGPVLHQFSSKSYMVMMIVTLFISWKRPQKG
ncbi:hypothetical protein AZI87_14740 [Bdellovibrio bacteriovorus]|uniref:Uncharacterized protein n=2 Tax=Bdellovibrio bacteriovorus TaxID=959 RepID=A0A161QED5_BDEBC|nr:hypothetical protein AZI87_14740 [Bdellovibrio bacteriovorus]